MDRERGSWKWRGGEGRGEVCVVGGSGVPMGFFWIWSRRYVRGKALRAGFWKGYCGVVDEEMVVLLGEEGGGDFGAGRRGAVGVDVKQWGVGFDSWGRVSFCRV